VRLDNTLPPGATDVHVQQPSVLTFEHVLYYKFPVDSLNAKHFLSCLWGRVTD
jgi:hypothetical protein